MTEREILEAMRDICAHQLRDDLHPLTCGNNSTHRVLVPVAVFGGNTVILRCLDCDYMQENYPLGIIRTML